MRFSLVVLNHALLNKLWPRSFQRSSVGETFVIEWYCRKVAQLMNGFVYELFNKQQIINKTNILFSDINILSAVQSADKRLPGLSFGIIKNGWCNTFINQKRLCCLWYKTYVGKYEGGVWLEQSRNAPVMYIQIMLRTSYAFTYGCKFASIYNNRGRYHLDTRNCIQRTW